ncbi:FMN-binding negative transcriptional regulator [Kitasatospora sp. NPDC056138]|uniref:FMN-binding negative transcriptional regulator n=1 Tax=Kitasatospora sp. NPDC056138 TaxID=3345724 RepID=UPI0035DADA56
MFVPELYRPQDPSWVLEIVRGHPLATLVSNGTAGPLATHLPMIPQEASLSGGTGETGLVGTVFHGHLNRMNPHWTALLEAPESEQALAVFHGPNAYVTPTVYQTSPAAPTWNFAAVHLRGTIRPITGRTETLEIVKSTVRAYERDHGTDWDMSGSLAYFEQIVGGVGAFRFEVASAEGMFKLSQEKTDEVREMVAESFAAGTPGGRQVSALMRRHD